MLHVDDGQLHAYLDGELEGIDPGASARVESHVEECAVCQARLDEARRLRTAAGAILRAADPSPLRLREFESFQAAAPPRLREVPNHHRALQRRATVLAWAASLVVACGIGWFARDLYFAGDTSITSRQMATLESSAAAKPAAPDSAAGDEPSREVESVQAETAEPPASAALASTAGITEVRQHTSATAENPSNEPARIAARTALPPAQHAAGISTAVPSVMPSATPVRELSAPVPGVALVAIARGRVLSESGAAVPHAQVAVAALNAGTLTRADGSYSLAIPIAHLHPNEPIHLSVRSSGFATESRPVDLAPGATVTADFRLRPETVALEALAVTGRPSARAERSRVAERRPGAEAVETHHPALPFSAVVSDAEHGRCRVANLRHIRDPSLTVFTGVARSDTVAVPTDAVEYAHHPGRMVLESREIHGQMIEVLRVGGTHAADVEQALAESGTREVVIVPWAFDVSCRPAPWHSTYRWIPAGEAAFFTVHLRQRQQWAEGRPTFDAFLGYTSPYAYSTYATTATTARLTPAQYFDLYQALPTGAELRRDPHHATAQLRAWEQANPDLAQRYPAGEILEAIRAAIAQQRESS